MSDDRAKEVAASDEPAVPKGGPDPVVTWATDHLPFLASLALFVAVVVRVLRVSEFDIGTATTLMRETGPVTLVLGVLVTSLPGLVIAAAFYLMILAVGGPGTRLQRRAAYVATLALWLVLTALVPWTTLIVVTLLLLGLYFFQRKFRWSLEFFAVATVVLTLFLDQPQVWLPPEIIDLADRGPVVGYVVSVDGEWTTILEEDHRQVDVVPSTSVHGRTVCNLSPRTSARTLGQILNGDYGGERNPPCP